MPVRRNLGNPQRQHQAPAPGTLFVGRMRVERRSIRHWVGASGCTSRAESPATKQLRHSGFLQGLEQIAFAFRLA